MESKTKNTKVVGNNECKRMIDSIEQSPYIPPVEGQIPRIGTGSLVCSGKYYNFGRKGGLPTNAIEALKELKLNVAGISFNVPHYSEWPELTEGSYTVDNVKEKTKWIEETLDNANLYDLKIVPCFNHGWDLNDNTEPSAMWKEAVALWKWLVFGYASNSQIAGWQLKDEPMIKQFPYLNEIKNAINSGEEESFIDTGVNGKHLSFANLFGYGSPLSSIWETPGEKDKNPSHVFYDEEGKDNDIIYRYHSITQTPEYTSTYKNYLDKFQEKFAPGVWCSDDYAFSNKGDYKTGVVTRIDFKGRTFIENCKIMSEQSKKTGKPFWVTIRTKAYYRKSSLINQDIPDAANCWYLTEDMMRVEAFISLLFGAQGLVEWSSFFVGNKDEEPNYEYLLAPIMIKPIDFTTCEIERTKLFDALKNVNNLIERYNEVFLGCNVKHVYYAGEYFKGVLDEFNGPLGAATIEIPTVEETFTEKGEDGEEVENTITVNKNKPGFIISYIQNGETTIPRVPYDFIAIMNLDMQYEHELKLKFNKFAVDLILTISLMQNRVISR